MLSQRTSTDIRDRFRLRYPQEYASTGLAPRPETFPHPPDRGGQTDCSDSISGGVDPSAKDPVLSHKDAVSFRSELPIMKPAEASIMERAVPAHVSLPDDVFFGLPADDEEMDTEPLVLDRGILDWAFDTTKPNAESSYGKVNNSLPPRRVATMPPSSSTLGNGGNVSAPLPSLASITAVSDDYDQLELPSLMQYFPSIEGDARATGHSFLSNEEVINQP